MHNVQESSQDNSSATRAELPAREENTPQSFQSREAQTKRPKLARNWQYLLGGGTVLLVVLVIVAGVLSSHSQTPKQPARSVPQKVPTAIIESGSSRTLPVPTTKPIPSPVSSDHNVSVTVVDGVVYAGTADNAMYALRMSDGSVLWQTKIDGAIEESPVVVNGVVYISSFVGQYGPTYLYALRATDGAVLWRYSGNSYIYAPTVSNGVVYMASQGDGITALQASDGTRLWHFAAQQGLAYQQPSLVNGTLYVSTGSSGAPGDVYALRASDGTELWHYKTSDFADTLTVQNGVIYLFSQSKLSALRANDGHELWSRPIDTTFEQSPQVIDGVIYFVATKISLETPTTRNASPLPQAMALGTLLWGHGQTAITGETVPLKAMKPLKEGKSTLYAIRASDGTMLWQYPMDNGGDSFGGWLQVGHGVIYTSAIIAGNNDNTGYIAALQSSDGKVVWKDKVNGSPAGMSLTGGTIYTTISTANGGAVYALRASDGAMLWNYPISGTLFGDPIWDNATLYIGAGNGMVYALRADNGALSWHYQTNVGF